MYEFNKTRQHIRQVTGDQRQNRPGIKVRPVEDGDRDTADVLQGLIRNIESVSNAERAYDTAFEWAITGGRGAWRIGTDYSDDSAFEQDICIKEIRNPLATKFDPTAQEFDKRDGMFAFVEELIGKEAFENKWPKAEVSNFESSSRAGGLSNWFFEDQVRICEYWYKEPVTRTLCLLSSGETVEKTPEFEAALPAL